MRNNRGFRQAEVPPPRLVACSDGNHEKHESHETTKKNTGLFRAFRGRPLTLTTGNPPGPSNVTLLIDLGPGGHMSLLKRLFGKSEPPKPRIRVCIECGMPLAEHKDWCSIHRTQIEMKRSTPAPSAQTS
jgi:hypothetical protein